MSQINGPLSPSPARLSAYHSLYFSFSTWPSSSLHLHREASCAPPPLCCGTFQWQTDWFSFQLIRKLSQFISFKLQKIRYHSLWKCTFPFVCDFPKWELQPGQFSLSWNLGICPHNTLPGGRCQFLPVPRLCGRFAAFFPSADRTTKTNRMTGWEAATETARMRMRSAITLLEEKMRWGEEGGAERNDRWEGLKTTREQVKSLESTLILPTFSLNGRLVTHPAEWSTIDLHSKKCAFASAVAHFSVFGKSAPFVWILADVWKSKGMMEDVLKWEWVVSQRWGRQDKGKEEVWEGGEERLKRITGLKMKI